MNRSEHFVLLADYNAWINTKLYTASGQLTEEAVSADWGAYFVSLLGTLNHICVADIIWLDRFSNQAFPSPQLDALGIDRPWALNTPLATSLSRLAVIRRRIDDEIGRWVRQLPESALDNIVSYENMSGTRFTRPFYPLLTHFFNHQTHHRGQATTLLAQSGVDYGVTDLIALIPQHVAEHEPST